MGAILQALHRLQQIERRLTEYRVKEQSIRRQVRNAQQQIDRGKSAYDAHLAAVTNCQMGIDSADLDIKSREESMNKHRQALNAARSNKEYAAILTALNTEKADTSKCENRVLELMARKEELLAKSQDFQQDRERLESRLLRHQQSLDAFTDDTAEDIARLRGERDEAAEVLPISALNTFERVASKHEGEAMASVIRVNQRGEEHMCGGCNMSVPLEHVNRLVSRDEVVLCTICGRILYLEGSKLSR